MGFLGESQDTGIAYEISYLTPLFPDTAHMTVHIMSMYNDFIPMA